jgi:microcystin-dependent protein
MPINRTNLTDRQANDFATIDDINDIYHAVNNLKLNAVDTSDGKFASADLELKVGADTSGDRGIKFWLDATTWLRFFWDQANSIFKFSNQSGVLQKVTFANGTAATHGITKGQLDSAISALQLEVTGAIKFYAGSSAPAGYLFCNGVPVSRTTYSILFSIIGTGFGSGDGTTTFNLPDLRGRVPLGLDNMGGLSATRISSASVGGANAATLGGSGGAETHTLITAEMPSHTHTSPVSAIANSATPNSGSVATSVSAVASVTSSSGSGNAHSNTQPWLALNYIIKT